MAVLKSSVYLSRYYFLGSTDAADTHKTIWFAVKRRSFTVTQI